MQLFLHRVQLPTTLKRLLASVQRDDNSFHQNGMYAAFGTHQRLAQAASFSITIGSKKVREASTDPRTSTWVFTLTVV